MDDGPKLGTSVKATVELSGEYEEIANIIGIDGREYDELLAVSDDMGAVLEIVARTGGATKSQIADKLPSDVSGELDSDTVIYMLRVLELYDFVTLDGNTWRPGSALPSE